MSSYNFSVTFYDPYDDGSHPFGDFNRCFDTLDEAFAYAEAEVEKDWKEEKANRKANYPDFSDEWHNQFVKRNTFVVQAHKV